MSETTKKPIFPYHPSESESGVFLGLWGGFFSDREQLHLGDGAEKFLPAGQPGAASGDSGKSGDSAFFISPTGFSFTWIVVPFEKNFFVLGPTFSTDVTGQYFRKQMETVK